MIRGKLFISISDTTMQPNGTWNALSAIGEDCKFDLLRSVGYAFASDCYKVIPKGLCLIVDSLNIGMINVTIVIGYRMCVRP